jgi:hypothetical protein
LNSDGIYDKSSYVDDILVDIAVVVAAWMEVRLSE